MENETVTLGVVRLKSGGVNGVANGASRVSLPQAKVGADATAFSNAGGDWQAFEDLKALQKDAAEGGAEAFEAIRKR